MVARGIFAWAMRLDLLHLLRSIRRSHISAGAGVLTLSLTLGAGAAIFAVVHAVLLTPPSFPSALRAARTVSLIALRIE